MTQRIVASHYITIRAKKMVMRLFMMNSITQDSFVNLFETCFFGCYALQGTNISPFEGTFEDDFPFPKVGYVSFLEGISLRSGQRI